MLCVRRHFRSRNCGRCVFYRLIILILYKICMPTVEFHPSHRRMHRQIQEFKKQGAPGALPFGYGPGIASGHEALASSTMSNLRNAKREIAKG